MRLSVVIRYRIQDIGHKEEMTGGKGGEPGKKENSWATRGCSDKRYETVGRIAGKQKNYWEAWRGNKKLLGSMAGKQKNYWEVLGIPRVSGTRFAPPFCTIGFVRSLESHENQNVS